MNTCIRKSIYWSPRVLAILFALFLMLFSLDVFNEASSFNEVVLGLLIHNIPSFLLLLVLVISWRLEWIGAILYPIFGLAYISQAYDKFPFITWLLISGPLILIGLLFYISWTIRRKHHPVAPAAPGL